MELLSYPQQTFSSVIHDINKELREKGYLHGNSGEDNKTLDDLGPMSKSPGDSKALQTEMRAQNFDVIRFATYRTACKLRFIQKKTSLALVDIWNIIEAFRENGLNTLEPQSELNTSRVESILRSIYNHLNKRLPSLQQVDTDQSLQLLLNWLISTYDRSGHGRIRVFSLKVTLSHMCAGKLMDKLRYMFTQLSDSSGYLISERFDEYLRDLLALPSAVYEGPSFGYTELAARSCFDNVCFQKCQINVNDFLNVMMADQGAQCLLWLPILHRMARVENVFHPVQCEGCHRESFMGFRYKCQHCFNYHLCQDCFWRGRSSGNHSTEHDMKEYTTFKSTSKQFGHNLKKTVQCVPNKARTTEPRLPLFPEVPEKTMDLSYIVPPTPPPARNGYNEVLLNRATSIDGCNNRIINSQGPSKFNVSARIETAEVSEEHRLIARYAARLAADSQNATRSPVELNFSLDTNKAQRELVVKLEAKNREIMREIHRLRQEQEAHARNTAEVQYSPTLMVELRQLRLRKEELERRMQALQENRKELMVQLESLMNLLKIHPTSPQSPVNGNAYRPTRSQSESPVRPHDYTSEPSTPALESLTLQGVGGDVQQAFSQPRASNNIRGMRTDLLVATDSVTSAMSSLVKELNSDADISEDEEDIADREANIEMADAYLVHTQESMEKWQQEVLKRADQDKDFISQLRARRQKHSSNSSSQYSDTESDNYENIITYSQPDLSELVMDDLDSFVKNEDALSDRVDDELYDGHPKELPNRMTSSTCTTDDDSFIPSDADSYIRTDDEEGGSTDWEESMKRWVNR